MEAENKPKSSSLSQILIILIVIVVTAIVVGGGVYLWMQNKDNEEDKTPTQNQSTSSTTAKTEKEPTVTPTKVTKNFMLATLGTLPGAKVDYDLAKTYLSDKLKVQFTEDAFVPEFYGIQQGPDDYDMKAENISNDTASVKVDAKYGTTMQSWAFILVKEGGEWKIDEFHNDAQ